MFDCYLLEDCSNERQRGSGSGVRGYGEELRVVSGAIIRIYYIEKNIFNKRKNEKREKKKAVFVF